MKKNKKIKIHQLLISFIVLVFITGCELEDIITVYNTLSVQVEGEGTVTPSEGEHRYERGSEVELNAEAAHGWQFKEWIGDVEDSNSPTTNIVVSSDTTITAVFEDKSADPTQFILIMEVEGEGNVVPEVGSHSFPKDSNIQIEAEPAENWVFENWTGDTDYVANIDAANTTLTMPGYDISITANFEKDEENGIEPIIGEGVTYHGYTYSSVIIDGREWFAENLRTTKYANGEDILTGFSSNTEWRNVNEGAYTIYPYSDIDGLNSEEEVLDAYGAIYNWYAVDDDRGLCPQGWSVPSDEEWAAMIDYMVDNFEEYTTNNVSDALKAARQVDHPYGEPYDISEHPRWDDDDSNYGTDVFGFSALPAGSRYTDSNFKYVGESGYWWTSTNSSASLAWYRVIGHHYGFVGRNDYSLSIGFSVRCIKDN